MTTIDDVKLIELPKFLDARGNLSFAENNMQIPFEIKRTYWIYDVPGGEVRGGHAFKRNQVLLWLFLVHSMLLLMMVSDRRSLN